MKSIEIANQYLHADIVLARIDNDARMYLQHVWIFFGVIDADVCQFYVKVLID